MPIKKAAKKAIRTSARARVKNLRRSRDMKELIKEAQELLGAGDMKKVQEMLPKIQKAIDKATKAGIIKKNTADRKKSRLVASIQRNTK